jgi:glycosyltransferase involved in cell wall biosynthesis
MYGRVDHRFFRPLNVDSEDYILAVGQEKRDYGTLLSAISGTGIKLIVVASSPWSSFRVQVEPRPEVQVLNNVSYPALRELYARARLVVTPLHPIDHSAGASTVLEAMAMARPQIVSDTTGLQTYLEHGETAMLVPPRDRQALRDAIRELWSNHKERSRIGANGRQAVAAGMSLDVYVDRVLEIASRVTPAASFRPDAQCGPRLDPNREAWTSRHP